MEVQVVATLHHMNDGGAVGQTGSEVLFICSTLKPPVIEVLFRELSRRTEQAES